MIICMHFHILYLYGLYTNTKVTNCHDQITFIHNNYFVMHDYITISPAQYFDHLNSCVIRNLATSMTFDASLKRPTHSGKTIVKRGLQLGQERYW